MTTPKRTSIGNIPKKGVDKELREFLGRIKQHIEVANQGGNSGMHRFVSIQDLVDLDLAQIVARHGNTAVNALLNGRVYVEPVPGITRDLSTPQALTDLEAVSTFRAIILTWDGTLFPTYGYTEIWRAQVDDLGQAVLAGTSIGRIYLDSGVDSGINYYYWVRAISVYYPDAPPGPFNAVAGTAAGVGLIGGEDLTDLIITAEKIADGSIDLSGDKITGLLSDLNMDVIGDPTKIADGLIGNAKLAALAVTAAKIADGSIDLSGTKITGLLSDLNMDVIGDPTRIADGLIGNAKLAALAVTAAKIADGSIDLSGTKITGILDQLNLGVISDPTKILDGLIDTDKLANLAVDAAKLADSSVTSTKIANLAVGTAAIQVAAITTALIANAAVGSAQIASAAITEAKIDALAVNTAAIQIGAITTALIANAAIGSAQIADAAITNAKIADAAIDTAAIQTAAITSALIANLAVGSAHIVNAAITEAKIADLAVGNAAIKNLAVTNSKIADLSVDKLFAVSGTIAEALIGTAEITDAMIGNIIQSTTYNPGGGVGWQLNKAGGFECAQITIRDTSGNVILTSGGQLAASIANSSQQWGDVGGTGKPANNATVGADWNSNLANIPAGLTGISYQATAPGSPGVGDYWIDSDDDKQYRWSGSAWELIQDASISQALSNAATAQATADGKVFVFAQTSAPTADGVGDLWLDTNDNNNMYRWSGAAWVAYTQDAATWGKVSGTGRPADNADVTGSSPQSPNWLSSPVVWSGNKVSSANIGTYISGLAVDTLYLADQAVTIPSSTYTAAFTALTNSWQTMASITYTSSGAPANIIWSNTINEAVNGDPRLDFRVMLGAAALQTISGVVVAVKDTVSSVVSTVPASGSVTISLEVKLQSNLQNIWCGQRSLTILETKK